MWLRLISTAAAPAGSRSRTAIVSGKPNRHVVEPRVAVEIDGCASAERRFGTRRRCGGPSFRGTVRSRRIARSASTRLSRAWCGAVASAPHHGRYGA